MQHPEFEPVPELFDIHVMAFADDSPAAAALLAEVFSIDFAEATALIRDAPVIVKRGASPAVAEQLLDVLARLGAQVVLLPSHAQPRPAAPLPARSLAPGEPVHADRAWGGLDLRAGGARSPASSPHVDDVHPIGEPSAADPAPSQTGGAQRAPTWTASESFAPSRQAARAKPAGATAATREEELGLAAEDALYAAPQADFDAGSGAGLDAATPDASYMAPEADFDADPFGDLSGDAPEDDALALGDESTSDPDAQGGPSLELAVPLPSRRRPAPPPRPSSSGRLPNGSRMPRAASGPVAAARGKAARPARPPAPDAGLGSLPPLPDLGLGSVPPLPSLDSLPPPTSAAPRAKGRSPRGQPLLSSQPRPAPRAGAAVQLPRGGGPGGSDGPRVPAGLVPPTPAEGWLSRTAIPDGPDLSRAVAVPALAQSSGAAGSGSMYESATEDRSRPRPGAANGGKPAPEVRQRGVAVLEILGGLAVLGAGLMLDNTVLHGNASNLWLALHGFAFYGIGAGLFGLRP